MKSVLGLTALCLLGLACGDSGGGDDSGGEAGTPGSGVGGVGGAGVGGGAGAIGDPMAGSGAGSGAGTGGQAGAAGGDPGSELVPFPDGSREYEHLYNLVDAEALADLELALVDQMAADTKRAARAFYRQYLDEYDFVIFVADHDVPDATVSAYYDHVRAAPIPGTGVDWIEDELDFGSEARLKGAIGTAIHAGGGRPPFAHEVLHRWANHLDPSLGFGRDADNDYDSHWGMTGVNGELGGFDETTLRCETPADALPPDCTPEEDGRFRYVMRYFGAYTNSFRDAPYSPLELYLMGLAPASEVPASFMLLQDARFDVDGLAAAGAEIVVEASGIGSIAFADIVALHGERTPVPEEERHLTSAFVVVSAQPATDAQLEAVSQWAETLGGHEQINGWESFETIASGRATLETRLGARRRIDQPAYVPPGEPGAVEVPCDLFDARCPLELGCYDPVHPICMPPGSGVEGDACSKDTDCEPGLGCAPSGECAEYCDPIGPVSPDSCSQRCGGAFSEVIDPASSMVVGAICEPGAGRWCDATAPVCEEGQGCYGIRETFCRAAGSTPEGQPCTEGSAECVPGTTCVAPEGSTSFTCQLYCSSHPDAVGDIDCDVRCPGNFLFVATWSICLP